MFWKPVSLSTIRTLLSWLYTHDPARFLFPLPSGRIKDPSVQTLGDRLYFCILEHKTIVSSIPICYTTFHHCKKRNITSKSHLCWRIMSYMQLVDMMIWDVEASTLGPFAKSFCDDSTECYQRRYTVVAVGVLELITKKKAVIKFLTAIEILSWKVKSRESLQSCQWYFLRN